MRTLILLACLALPVAAQVGETIQKGTVMAQIDTYPKDDEACAIRISALSFDPSVIAYEITVLFEADGELSSRTAIAQRGKDRTFWTLQYFSLPPSVKVLSFSILERKNPQVFTVARLNSR